MTEGLGIAVGVEVGKLRAARVRSGTGRGVLSTLLEVAGDAEKGHRGPFQPGPEGALEKRERKRRKTARSEQTHEDRPHVAWVDSRACQTL